MTRLVSSIIALVCVSTTVGCGVEGEAEGPAVIIGTGEVNFEPLADMQELQLVAGPQGGYHFVANARIQDLDPGTPSMPGLLSNPSTTFSLYREDGSRIDAEGPASRLGYAPSDDGWYELPSGRILEVSQKLVKEDQIVPAIYSERVRIQVEVLDAEGTEVSAEVWVIPQI